MWADFDCATRAEWWVFEKAVVCYRTSAGALICPVLRCSRIAHAQPNPAPRDYATPARRAPPHHPNHSPPPPKRWVSAPAAAALGPRRRRVDAGHPYPQRPTTRSHLLRGGRQGVALVGSGYGSSGAAAAAQRRRRRCGRLPLVRPPPTLLQWKREGGEVASPRKSKAGRRDAAAPPPPRSRAASPLTAAAPRRVAAVTIHWDDRLARPRADVPASRPRLPPAPGRHLTARCVLSDTPRVAAG